MRRTTLAGCGVATLAAAFNTVYSYYVMPFQMSPEQAQRHVKSTAIDLAHSPLWLDDAGAVQALAALGIRGRRGWIGGFGVAPPYRGQGMGHALLRAVFEIAARLDLTRIELEVLANNPAAIHLYERGGFQRSGNDLIGLRGAPGAPPGVAAQVREIDRAEALRCIALLRPLAPCWQREGETLSALPATPCLLLGEPSDPLAVLIYSVSEAGVVIADIAACTAEAAEALIAALASKLPGRHMYVSNELEGNAVCTALLKVGWVEIWRQHRMVCPL